MKIKQLSVFVENKTGRINEVTQILGSNGVNMTAFSLADSGEFGILRMIVSDVGRAVSALKEARFGISVTEVVCFCCPNDICIDQCTPVPQKNPSAILPFQ